MFLTLGGTWTESGGQAVMSSAGVAPNPAISGGVEDFALLNTNTDPASDLGLKYDAAFTVSSTFGLTAPPTGSYGMELNDGTSTHGVDQLVRMIVTKSSGSTVVELVQRDLAVNPQTTNVIASQTLTAAQLAGNNQIEFQLSHVANTSAVIGSFELIDNGTVTLTTTFASTAPIFTGGVDWTRVDIGAFMNPSVGLNVGAGQSPLEGQTLTASAATNDSDATTINYQWQESASSLFTTFTDLGTNSPTYVVQASDVGSFIRVVATASDADNLQSATATSQVTGVVNGLPVIAVPSAQTIGVNMAAAISGVSLSESGNSTGETFTVMLTDTHGDLSATGTGVSGSGTTSLTITGTLSQVNADLTTLSDTDGTATSGAPENITLNASDGFNSASQQTIAVTVNGIPMITVPGAQTLGVGQETAISGVSISESGNTSGSETFTATLSDTCGDLSATGTGVSGSGTTGLTITGSLSQVNSDLATLHDTDATTGSDTIMLNAHDSFGNAAAQKTIAVAATPGWTGDTVDAQYLFPTISSLYLGANNFTVPGSVLSTNLGGADFFTLSVANTTITANFAADVNGSSTATWSATSFNGFEVIDESKNPLISGVMIDPSTNMSGLNSSRISFSSNTVWVNWEGLSFNNSTIVKLDLTFDPPLDPSQVSIAQTLDGSTSPSNNTGTLTVDDGTGLALIGTIDNSGVIAVNASTTATAIEVEGSVTLQGGGQINLSLNNQNYIYGSGDGATLTNIDNTISGGGDIGNGSLVFDNAGVIAAQGPYALIIDTGSNPFVNTGTLETDGGTLIVNSPVTGGGNAVIAGGTLEFSGAADNNVSFSGSNAGMLALDQSEQFTGSIAGFGSQDQIDLGDIAFSANATLAYTPNGANSGGTLTVGDGINTQNIALLGQYMASNFFTASDGHGGTLISDPLPNQQQSLAQPHA